MAISVETTVRLATLEDTERIKQLSEQLGYPSTTAEIARRLAELLDNSEHAVFVAENSGTLVGWIHVVATHSLTAHAPGEISGLVVDEQHRGHGLGQLLMARAEKWAREKGCGSIRLRSNVVRSRAHAFYERRGYRVIKTQKAFSKVFAS